MKNIVVAAIVALGVLIAAISLFIGSGIYNVAADAEHSGFVYWLIETTRERSIAARAADISVPELDGGERIRRGAGNYDAMCAGCHLAPGLDATEISRGLYPKPPDLTKVQSDPARAFWIIKHGIKATGMPAWGKSMKDEYIWDMVALVRKLPELTAGQYTAEVRASGGHSHDGDESGEGAVESASHDESGSGHSHDKGAAGHSHGKETAESSQGAAEHAHRPGTSSAGSAHKEGSASRDPLGVAKALHAALSSGDAAAVERLLAPDVLIMEGGNVERSRKEYAAHHLQSDVKFMKQVSYKLDRQTSDTGAALAWVASEARMSGAPAGKAIDLISTETLVMKKTPSGWQIVHIHWSSRSAPKG